MGKWTYEDKLIRRDPGEPRGYVEISKEKDGRVKAKMAQDTIYTKDLEAYKEAIELLAIIGDDEDVSLEEGLNMVEDEDHDLQALIEQYTNGN